MVWVLRWDLSKAVAAVAARNADESVSILMERFFSSQTRHNSASRVPSSRQYSLTTRYSLDELQASGTRSVLPSRSCI